MSGCDFLAFFRAYFTNPCAFLAMIGLVFKTFFVTLPANIGAYLANCFCRFTSKAHQLSRRITNSCAFHIKLNASGHHMYIFFLRARAGTMITGISTTKTGFDAGFVFRIIIGLFHHYGFTTCSKSQTISDHFG